jgi:tetratricopeptide (TPR) repeat protein
MTATPHVAHDGPGTGEACLDAQLLASYIDGQVTTAERARVEAHLTRCNDCYFVFSETVQAANAEREVPAVPPVKEGGWKFRVDRRVAAGFAAAAAMVVAFQIYRSDTRRDDTTLVAALNNLEAAAGPYRQFEARLSDGSTYKPQIMRVRSASPAEDAPLAVRAAALQVQQATTNRKLGVQERRALAVMYLTLGNAEEAADVVGPAVVPAGADAALLNDMAAALLARGDTGDVTRALQLLDQAVPQDPNRPEIWFNIGLAAEAADLPARARDAWTRYLTIDSSSQWAKEVRQHLDRVERSHLSDPPSAPNQPSPKK